MNALTIDFEDWYHGLTSTSTRHDEWSSYARRIEEATDWLLGTLADESVRATFFILGVVAREHPGLVHAIAEAGHEIGLHGDMHRLVRCMDREEFRLDLMRNKTAVEEAAGRAATCFRAPCFSVSEATPWLWEELARARIFTSSSLFPVRTPLYGQPSAPRWPVLISTPDGAVAEVPMSTLRITGANLPFSGGFYFRALPYALVRASARWLNSAGRPVVFYFHPWEFDAHHPRPSHLTARERLSHYGGLDGTRRKFLRLLQDFRLGPLGALPRGEQILHDPLQTVSQIPTSRLLKASNRLDDEG